VGMLDAWGDHPVVQQALKEASDALHEDMGQLISQGPKEALALTTNTQPVMLVAAVAAYRVWMSETGVAPAAVAGHSLGEYSALVASGVLTLSQAAPLVRFRAQAMQEAVPVGVGAMAAILGMEAAKVIAGCAEVSASFGPGSLEVVEAVNFNDPAQTVIAGSKAAVEKACEVLKAQGAKRALPLPVSAPFHSSLMKPAAERLLQQLANTVFLPPQIPLINNIDVAVETDADRMRDALYRQAFGPVRWVQCVQAIKARGLSTLVECGPGKVLAGMVKRIDPELTGLALLDPASLADVKTALTGA
jgi:[acyl-carrier-protein] S-malonyltransferase